MRQSNFLTKFFFPCQENINQKIKENAEEVRKLIDVVRTNKVICVRDDKTP